MPTAHVRGARLWYAAQGSGPALLWIPGFGAGAAVTEPAVARWSDRFTAVTYDHRGAARSPARRLPASTADLAADAAGLLSHLGIARAHVIGASMGGMVAQELALRFPERVRGLVLLSTTPGGPHAEPPTAQARRALLARLRGTRPDPARLEALLFAERTRREHPERVAEALALLRAHPPPPAGAAAHLAAMALHDTERRLARVRTPTLVVHGREDRIVPVSNARLLAARLPDVETALLDDAGHAAALERPEALARRLGDWLDRRFPAPPGPEPDPPPAPGALAGLAPLPGALARAPLTLWAQQRRRRARPRAEGPSGHR